MPKEKITQGASEKQKEQTEKKNKQTNKKKKVRENESDLDAIGIRFASDWLRRWHEFSEPITVQNEENQSIPR